MVEFSEQITTKCGGVSPLHATKIGKKVDTDTDTDTDTETERFNEI